ncbi:hypothetical protein M0813_19111 [Anaeramoeba flamelloides]|uniref:Uncharacterized protein n=1 Tax=Anaeramoeba flamelloides TaxID=1746091 RepID=A0ABQ8YPL8_9EUKA|nr:hypothetical protein M0813_19111 [Anaeramoeba flamelloides]
MEQNINKLTKLIHENENEINNKIAKSVLYEKESQTETMIKIINGLHQLILNKDKLLLENSDFKKKREETTSIPSTENPVSESISRLCRFTIHSEMGEEHIQLLIEQVTFIFPQLLELVLKRVLIVEFIERCFQKVDLCLEAKNEELTDYYFQLIETQEEKK